MAEVKCFNCGASWDFEHKTTYTCPECGWITEIYYDSVEAREVADLYNNQQPPIPSPAGVLSLSGIDAHAVSFPDQGRLEEITSNLLSKREAELRTRLSIPSAATVNDILEMIRKEGATPNLIHEEVDGRDVWVCPVSFQIFRTFEHDPKTGLAGQAGHPTPDIAALEGLRKARHLPPS